MHTQAHDEKSVRYRKTWRRHLEKLSTLCPLHNLPHKGNEMNRGRVKGEAKKSALLYRSLMQELGINVR
jgi:hypothetical protein